MQFVHVLHAVVLCGYSLPMLLLQSTAACRAQQHAERGQPAWQYSLQVALPMLAMHATLLQVQTALLCMVGTMFVGVVRTN